MAYKLMKTMINNYKNGRTVNSKDRMSEMCDVYYAAGRLTDSEYKELIAEIDALN